MLPALFLATVWAFTTPQAAAVRVVHFGRQNSPIVRRVNFVGRYAAVLTNGGVMDGARVTAPILLERFSFGWQPIDLLNFRCNLLSHALGSRIDLSLMMGMPTAKNDEPCNEKRADTGPPSDVEAVRKLMRGPLVPYVLISDGWALGEWFGGGGGQTLYRYRGGRWLYVSSGGGAMGISLMQKRGVPRSSWCKLQIYDANCHY